MGEPVEQSASEAFGAEHLGPFGKQQRPEVQGQELAQPGWLSSPRSARVVARMAPERRDQAEAEAGSIHTGKPRARRANAAGKPQAPEPAQLN